MFSYYGSKSKIAKYYPSPKYELIIEPFAGAANYSLLHYNNHKVWINDKYEIIYKLWKYLQNITLEEINSIPNMKQGDDIRNLNVSENMRLLLGFVAGRGVAQPHNIYTKWSEIGNSVKQSKNRLLKYLNRAKNWTITNLNYTEIPNQEATWFIDPPYQNGGKFYVCNHINYIELADWCKNRKGQVIVCENSSANWMDFKPLKEIYGQQKRTMEVIWTN